VCCGFGVDFCVCFVDLALICLVFVGWHRFPLDCIDFCVCVFFLFCKFGMDFSVLFSTCGMDFFAFYWMA